MNEMYVFPNYTIYDRLSALFIGLMRINHEQYFFMKLWFKLFLF